MKQDLVFTNDIDATIEQMYSTAKYDGCFVLCDTNTEKVVLPQIKSPIIKQAKVITIEAGDTHKNIESLCHVWQKLSDMKASRSSLLINLGGGMVSDLGGFAAATFKRGIEFVNIPTTLLAAVDAAVGGKTGINFNGLKNEVGVFAPAHTVIISTLFFKTLPREELLSGYAEMLKHSLIDAPEHYNRLLDFDILNYDAEELLQLLRHSVNIKNRIVAEDPDEKGVRKALNLGHTVGHAFESHALHHGNPIPHGYAVAWGLIAELVLSHRRFAFPSNSIYDMARYIEQCYGSYFITCDDYDELYNYMLHDKKNENGVINFTLLCNIGEPIINCPTDRKEIDVALDMYRDLFHL